MLTISGKMIPLKLIRGSIRKRPNPETQWTFLDRNPLTLLRELTELYWVGVERDLQDIMRALQLWKQQEYISVPPLGQTTETENWVGSSAFVKRATRKGSDVT
jgi:hypothetical protein